MKILSIGPAGILEKYNTDPEFFCRHQVVELPMNMPVCEKLAEASDAEVIVADAIAKIPEELIAGMKNLKMIHTNGVAYNGVDIAAEKKYGVYVCNCKGMNARPVAEHAIMLMVGLLRGVVINDRKFREGHQLEVKEGYMAEGTLRELGDCTIGLIGFGDIAKEVAKFAELYGAKVLYYSRHRASEEVELELGVEYKALHELLSESDIVSLHLPVTADTKGYVGQEFLSKMKKGSYLVNTARGEVIDDEAVLNALRDGTLAGAAFDTVSGEPVKQSHPLLNAEPQIEEKMIFSCHLGGITASSFKRGYEMIFQNISYLDQGLVPVKQVY